jgi:chromosome segregation ATPase
MRIRHRTPTIFSLSLMDILCCALGCVIILWLIEGEKQKAIARRAQESEKQANKLPKMAENLRTVRELLATAEKERDNSRKTLAELTTEKESLDRDLALRLKEIERLKKEAAATGLNLEQLRLAHAKLQDESVNLQKQLKTFRVSEKTLRELLATAEKERDNSRKTLAELSTKKESLDRDLALRLKEIERLKKEATATGLNLETTSRDLTAARKRATDLAQKLEATQTVLDKTDKTAREVPKLRADLAAALDRLSDEQKAALALKTNLEKQQKALADARQEMAALEKARRLLEDSLDNKTKDLARALVLKERLAEAEKKREQVEKLLGLNEKELGKALAAVERAEEEKRKAQAEATRTRAAAEQRFAGITLKGKRVIFLVDTSGSMDLLDERTAAPSKWIDVRRTVVQVMHSLPDLAQFQVIAFAEDAQFLLGKPGEWLDYDPKTSEQAILNELAKLKPKGGTNMYQAMEAAFRYRGKGLDSIYLFSDGLPNAGEGLTPTQERTIQDQTQRSTLLAHYIRNKVRNDWNRPQVGSDRVRVNSVGFFFESPDVGAFLWGLSRENEGSFVGMSKP